MPRIDVSFDGIEPATNNFELLPAGKYLVMATASEVKETKAGTGYYVTYTLEVLEGSHKGRKLWESFNVNNPSKQAEEIAKRQLKAFAMAAGIAGGGVGESEELHDIPVMIDVGRQEGKDGYPAKNVIRGWAAPGSAPVSARPEPPTASVSALPRAAWKRG